MRVCVYVWNMIKFMMYSIKQFVCRLVEKETVAKCALCSIAPFVYGCAPTLFPLIRCSIRIPFRWPCIIKIAFNLHRARNLFHLLTRPSSSLLYRSVLNLSMKLNDSVRFFCCFVPFIWSRFESLRIFEERVRVCVCCG